MTTADDDPIVQQLRSLHEKETARAVEDLKRPTSRAMKPRIRTVQPSLLGLGAVVVVLVVVASATLFGGVGSRPVVTPGTSAQSTSPASGESARPTGSTARAETTEGPFRLVFELPKDTWRADEAIDGLATLSLVEGTGIDLGGSGGGLLGFGIDEVDGSRHMGPAFTADCAPYRLEAGRPMASPIKKSGGFSADEPNADFYRSFFADPAVHLPPGDWTISAVASFVEGQGCSGQSHDMRTSILVHVLPTSGSLASPSPGDPVDALAAALSGAGATVRRSGPLQASQPFQMPGVKLCVDSSNVRVYVYPDAGQLEAVVNQIDPRDPSHVGSSVVDWIGPPRLWQRDRLLVTYLGDSQATEDLLTSVLGAPFARGVGGKFGPVDDC